MTRLKQLTITCLMVVVVGALSPIAPHDQPYSSINFYGKRPQPVFQQETSIPSTESSASANEELLSHSLGAAKVIIRPVSQLSTLAPPQNQQQENDNKADGCKCEPINSCPIELMDFRFAVSCEYGTVRCCRPLEPVLIKETTSSRPVVVTPASTLKWPRKSCRCKPRKECDEQAIDRKSEIGCSAGNVRCCETGTNAGHSKTETDAHVLGGNGFRPVQLPFLKMPQPADERISEHEPRPTDQELQPIENTAMTSENVSVEDSLLATTTEKEQEEIKEQLEEQQNKTPLAVQHFKPSQPLSPNQHQINPQFAAPIRQSISPIRNPTFNSFHLNQNQNQGSQLQQPSHNQPSISIPFQQLQPPIRPMNSNFRPPINVEVNAHQLGQPIHTQFQPNFPMGPPPMIQQGADKPFNFQSPMGSSNFNQQQQPPQRRPTMPTQPNTFPQQQFQRPPPPPASTSGGGFFSSLMNMFGN